MDSGYLTSPVNTVYSEHHVSILKEEIEPQSADAPISPPPDTVDEPMIINSNPLELSNLMKSNEINSSTVKNEPSILKLKTVDSKIDKKLRKKRISKAKSPRWHNIPHLIYLTLRKHYPTPIILEHIVLDSIQFDKSISQTNNVHNAIKKNPFKSISEIINQNEQKMWNVVNNLENPHKPKYILSFIPDSLEYSLSKYNEWLTKLEHHDWPYLFSMKRPWLERGGDDFSADTEEEEKRVVYKRLRKVSKLKKLHGVKKAASTVVEYYLSKFPSEYEEVVLEEEREMRREFVRLKKEEQPSSSSEDDDENDEDDKDNLIISDGLDNGSRSTRLRSGRAKAVSYKDMFKYKDVYFGYGSDKNKNIKTNTHNDGDQIKKGCDEETIGTDVIQELNNKKKRKRLNMDGIPIHARKATDQFTGEAFVRLKIDDIPKSIDEVLEVKESSIPNSGLGLFARRFIPANTPVGFYFGVPLAEEDFDKSKASVGRAKEFVHRYQNMVIDATNEVGEPYPKSVVNCPFHYMNEDLDRRNVIYQDGLQTNQIICTTIKDIHAGEELFTSYGKDMERPWNH